MQKSGECVIVARRDRVELVIVAARASAREPEKCLGQNVNLIVHFVRTGFHRVRRAVQHLAKPVEPCAQRRFPVCAIGAQAFLRQQIAGDVFFDKLIVGNVLVEGPNDVIAIPPGVELVIVEFVPIGFRKAHQVQPVTCPSFAIVRRSQKPIHDALLGQRGCIRNEGLDLLRT